ncbi:MAG: DUF3489 domain-containing protein [Rhodospirillales bacterium]|jgi:hypothetical protein|nr:DUF3489 domain-containing protein [Rhodospirillales bacterium]MBT4626609.1 DUF3489 domain-containing protein [Rhodospirillales bacterium]MBT5816915.1 DUF3489 domain-containing protein [Pseudomonadota bacterium]MBT6825147.1 DUF3489 domain-containing protein [Rhodospirillales bacterium]MBT7146565.1 DUF3489 domain-containing protein [Rhodospirillales bacterium]
MPNKPTKTDAVIRLLKRPQGASIAQLQKPTGWQPHSVRAALTGLRKKGHEITRDKNDAGVTVYRIRAGAGE